MTSTTIGGLVDEIAELKGQIEKLVALANAGPSSAAHKRSLRRPLAIVATAVLGVGMLAGVAGASGSTTDVSFVALTPSHAVLSNSAILTHKTSNPVVIGGSTTVPSNATTVELQVTAKGAVPGTLTFYPAGNPSGGSGQSLTYPGSTTTTATATIQENVGMSGELTVYNSGSGTATVTAKIIGYSTQVTAGDISGAGGTAGQVLTNNGSGGATWQQSAATTPSEGWFGRFRTESLSNATDNAQQRVSTELLNPQTTTTTVHVFYYSDYCGPGGTVLTSQTLQVGPGGNLATGAPSSSAGTGFIDGCVEVIASAPIYAYNSDSFAENINTGSAGIEPIKDTWTEPMFLMQ